MSTIAAAASTPDPSELSGVHAIRATPATHGTIQVKTLVEELKALRAGLGVEDSHLVARAGSSIRYLSGVRDEDSPWMVREKIKAWLAGRISQLPEATARLGRVVFGFDGPGDLPYLARLESLGSALHREVRTMQRRADSVIVRIAEVELVATAKDNTLGNVNVAHRDTPWHTNLLRVDLILDQPEIEVFENRRIISHIDNLTEVRHSISIPSLEPARPLDLADVAITLLGGGEMREAPRIVSSTRVEIIVTLPRPLHIGEQHEFFFRARFSSMLPFYLCTPRFVCDEFQLRSRFGRDQIPDRIWLVDGELPIEASDPIPRKVLLRADPTGEVLVKFVDLHPAMSYGIGWMPGDHAASVGGTHTH